MMNKYRPVFYLLPLVLFVASAIPAVWVGYDPSLALPTLAFLLAGGLLSVLISLAGRSPRVWEWTAGLFVLVCTLIAGYVLTQAGRLDTGKEGGMIFTLAALIARITPDFAFWRPNMDSVAVFLESAPFLAVGLALSSTRRRPQFLWLAAAGLILAGIAFSASRGDLLAIAAGILLWAACYWKPARVLALACTAAVAALVAFVVLRGDISAVGEIPGLSALLGPIFIRPDRLEVYRNSLALVADAPFTGIGLGDQFALVYSRYELLIPYVFLNYSHNLYLEILLEQGLAGFLAWMGLIATVFTAAWNHRRHSRRLHLEAVWAGMAVIWLHGMIEARQFADLPTWLPFFILVGLYTALLWDHQPQERRVAWVAPVVITVVCAGIFLAMSGSLPAAYLTNRGALRQQRADLQPGLNDSQKSNLRAQAAQDFQQALLIEPERRSANQRLGMIYLEQQDYPAAIQALERSLQRDPLHPGTRKALGLTYAFSGRTMDALPLLQDLPNIVGELNYWGWFFDVAGQPTPGYNALVVSLAIEPDQPDIADYAEILRQRIPVNDL